MSRHRDRSTGSIEAGFARLSTADGSRHASPPLAIVRKADLAYNHVEFAKRPGECKVAMKSINVLCNYFKITTPSRLQAHCYRIELEAKGRAGFQPVLKREKAEPLFWSFYQQHRSLFPRALNRIVFDGVSTIYSLDPLRISNGTMSVQFPATAARDAGGRGGGQRAPPLARATIITLPMFKTSDFFTDEESIRTQIVQLMDLILSQEMRCPLVANASRFIQQGHSIFRVPVTDREKSACARPIGRGEEVWTGLHMAVKADCTDQLYLNANTSSSIFYTSKLCLVQFYSQVLHGYTLHQNGDNARLAIEPHKIDELSAILKDTKVRVQKANGDWTVKKFQSITRRAASVLEFEYDDRDGRKKKITVAEYFSKIGQKLLEFPNLPCLQFINSSGACSLFPLEMCTTHDEPRKYKGKLKDSQLNAFIKAVGMRPRDKQRLIETLTASDGSYLGQGTLAQEWGVEVDRNLVKIEKASVLLYPDMKWKDDRVSKVNEISAEYTIAEDERQPKGMIETGKPLALVMVFVNGDGCDQFINRDGRLTPEQVATKRNEVYVKKYRENTELFVSTLRGYGMKVIGPAWTFAYLIDDIGRINKQGIDQMIEHFKKEIAEEGKKQAKEFTPLFAFVLERRIEKLYACIKYKCDVEHGVLSQVILKATFQKLTGNAITNASSKNLLLKVLAKAGGVACRIDGEQFRNVAKMTNPKEPTLVLGIDVSHPSREERMKALEKAGKTPNTARTANQQRGRHEQLPTAHIAATNLFKDLPYHDCPRSVVAIVGNTDLHHTKWGVSARLQRLSQEETVNLTEPFKARIEEFHRKTGALPKHVILLRDGVSDTQFKKALYEETQALERALEDFSLPLDQVTITYIVAKKRHHTRFFAADPNQAKDLEGRPGANTPPGLLVDKMITSRNTFDFFLQSHYGAIGTVVPTHYSVLRDDWKPSQSFWQTAVFAQCFGNARCTKPLSIPVPLHYAHLAAKRSKLFFDHFRVRENAPDEYHNSREDLIKESLEMKAITAHDQLKSFDSMYFA